MKPADNLQAQFLSPVAGTLQKEKWFGLAVKRHGNKFNPVTHINKGKNAKKKKV